MTIPSVILAFVIASLLGALFHLWRGGGAGRLALYLLLAWTGFFAGHFLAAWLGWTFAALGPINLGGAVVGGLLFLFGGDWLSRPQD